MLKQFMQDLTKKSISKNLVFKTLAPKEYARIFKTF